MPEANIASKGHLHVEDLLKFINDQQSQQHCSVVAKLASDSRNLNTCETSQEHFKEEDLSEIKKGEERMRAEDTSVEDDTSESDAKVISNDDKNDDGDYDDDTNTSNRSSSDGENTSSAEEDVQNNDSDIYLNSINGDKSNLQYDYNHIEDADEGWQSIVSRKEKIQFKSRKQQVNNNNNNNSSTYKNKSKSNNNHSNSNISSDKKKKSKKLNDAKAKVVDNGTSRNTNSDHTIKIKSKNSIGAVKTVEDVIVKEKKMDRMVDRNEASSEEKVDTTTSVAITATTAVTAILNVNANNVLDVRAPAFTPKSVSQTSSPTRISQNSCSSTEDNNNNNSNNSSKHLNVHAAEYVPMPPSTQHKKPFSNNNNHNNKRSGGIDNNIINSKPYLNSKNNAIGDNPSYYVYQYQPMTQSARETGDNVIIDDINKNYMKMTSSRPIFYNNYSNHQNIDVFAKKKKKKKPSGITNTHPAQSSHTLNISDEDNSLNNIISSNINNTNSSSANNSTRVMMMNMNLNNAAPVGVI